MSGILCHRAPPRCVSLGKAKRKCMSLAPLSCVSVRQYLAHPPHLFPLWRRESAPKAAPIATSHSSPPAQKSSTPTTPGDEIRPAPKINRSAAQEDGAKTRIIFILKFHLIFFKFEWKWPGCCWGGRCVNFIKWLHLLAVSSFGSLIFIVGFGRDMATFV